MAKISETCKQNVSEIEKEIIEFLREMVPVREYLRVLGRPSKRTDYAIERILPYIRSGGVPADTNLDETLTEALKLDFGDFLQKGKDFHRALNEWRRTNGYPSWDNGLCVMRWRDFACFCNGAAHADRSGQLPAYLKSFEKAGGVINSRASNLEFKPKSCDPAVMADPFYTDVSGSTSRQGPSIWWIVGGVAVFGVLMAPVVFGKKASLTAVATSVLG